MKKYIGSSTKSSFSETFQEHPNDFNRGKQNTARGKYLKENSITALWNDIRTYSYHSKIDNIRTHENMLIQCSQIKKNDEEQISESSKILTDEHHKVQGSRIGNN